MRDLCAARGDLLDGQGLVQDMILVAARDELGQPSPRFDRTTER